MLSLKLFGGFSYYDTFECIVFWGQMRVYIETSMQLGPMRQVPMRSVRLFSQLFDGKRISVHDVGFLLMVPQYIVEEKAVS